MPDVGQPTTTLGIDWERVAHRLGREPDQVLAAELRCSVSLVRLERKRRGVPVLEVPRSRPWSDDEVARLATTPTATLARELGCGSWAVEAERRRRGIPSPRGLRPLPKPVDKVHAAPPSPPPSSTCTAFVCDRSSRWEVHHAGTYAHCGRDEPPSACACGAALDVSYVVLVD